MFHRLQWDEIRLRSCGLSWRYPRSRRACVHKPRELIGVCVHFPILADGSFRRTLFPATILCRSMSGLEKIGGGALSSVVSLANLPAPKYLLSLTKVWKTIGPETRTIVMPCAYQKQ